MMKKVHDDLARLVGGSENRGCPQTPSGGFLGSEFWLVSSEKYPPSLTPYNIGICLIAPLNGYAYCTQVNPLMRTSPL